MVQPDIFRRQRQKYGQVRVEFLVGRQKIQCFKLELQVWQPGDSGKRSRSFFRVTAKVCFPFTSPKKYSNPTLKTSAMRERVGTVG